MTKTRVSNWGNYPTVEANVTEFSKSTELSAELKQQNNFTVRGTGLSYGDASLGKNILSTLKFKKILAFDEAKGIISVEAGATIDEVLQVTVPKGWFVPVTPGTKFITLGGAVGGDVHGKNHHGEGAFCRYVTSMEVMMADGLIRTIDPVVDKELFDTVCGGLGLACVILKVTFQLKPIQTSYIRQTNVIIRNLDEMIARINEFQSATYSVAWIDTLARGKDLGRGVLMLGEHATADEVKAKDKLKSHKQPKLKVPFNFPGFILNSFTIRTFNTLFYNKHKIAAKDFIVHYDPYFYPLDFAREWNKMYGKRGFLQYQFVLPFETASKGLRVILEAISKQGASSFLSVLKAMGDNEHPISFPMPGLTLALDFPVSPGIFPFLDKLDKIVVELGGRIYLVKDARMKPHTYWTSYDKADWFKGVVNKYDPENKFASDLSRRLQMISGSKDNLKHSFKGDIVADSYLILGAKSDIGIAMAAQIKKANQKAILAARDTAAVLKKIEGLPGSGSIEVVSFNAREFDKHEEWFYSLPYLPATTVCLFGYLGDQSVAANDWSEAQNIIEANYTGAVSILNVASRVYGDKGTGTIVGFSSVAGDRGRQSNFIYGSAKAGFTAYLSGLRNSMFHKGVHVLTVLPGFMNTSMTADLKTPKVLTAEPDDVAKTVLKAARKKKNSIYVYSRWYFVMLIVKNIPEFVFKRLKM